MKTTAKSPRDNKQVTKKRVPSRKVVSKESNPQPSQRQQIAAERRVVLFDLDGTLMDSGTAWRESSRRAITRLTEILPRGLDQGTAMDAYRAIYECHGEIKDRGRLLGHTFEDMRQEWNTRTSYALLLAWSGMKELQSFSGTLHGASHYKKALQDLLNNDVQAAKLFDDAEEFRDTWSIERAAYIDSAMDEFWNEDFASCYLYPGVRELMRGLRQKGIDYYIATEGHLPTQWRKIRAWSCLI